jgi:serine/threonine protein kinase
MDIATFTRWARARRCSILEGVPAVVLADRFELKNMVAFSPRGSVHEAVDRTTGARVAVKILSARPGASAGARFAQEAELLTKLQSPGVVRYVASGLTQKGDPFIATEWLEGETLRTRLSKGALSPADTVTLGRELLEALAPVHREGVIHRDVKPSNIFLVDSRIENLRLIDFGIARFALDPKRITDVGMMVGTPSYTSPEQARGEGNLDSRADVFSVGCVLWECLTGKPPFGGRTPTEILTQICLGPPARIDPKHDVPKALAQMLESMVVQDRSQRPGNAAELAERLAALRL